MLPKGQVPRTGAVCFGDASLRIWEEGIPREWEARECWERRFKRQVFARIVNTMNRCGWSLTVPQEYIDQYGRRFALTARSASKGDLHAFLKLTGRCIELEFFQNVNAPDRPDHLGRYQFDKERHMPYLLRLEMERTRRRIKDYLCAVFTDYSFKPQKTGCGPGGLTALDWVKQSLRGCWHYKPELDRRDGENSDYNNESAEGGTVKHGTRVWFFDPKGRLMTGVAHYNINNMWWVISGRYGRRSLASFELFTQYPGAPRVKRNAELREKRLRELIKAAVDRMDFEKAAKIRDLLLADSQEATVQEAA